MKTARPHIAWVFGILIMLTGENPLFGQNARLSVTASHIKTPDGEMIEFQTKNVSSAPVQLYKMNLAGAASVSTKISGIGSGPVTIDLPRQLLVDGGLSDEKVTLAPGRTMKRRILLDSEFHGYEEWKNRKDVVFVFTWIWDNSDTRRLGIPPQVGTVVIRK